MLNQSLVGGRGVHAKQVTHDLLEEGKEGIDKGVQMNTLLIDHVLVRRYNLLQRHQP